jgi:hypothetical protein
MAWPGTGFKEAEIEGAITLREKGAIGIGEGLARSLGDIGHVEQEEKVSAVSFDSVVELFLAVVVSNS